MYKYQYFTQNLAIILKKTRLMEKYILGFQIRKIFPFHLVLGSPDWDYYEEVLNGCLKELSTQKIFSQQQLTKLTHPELVKFYKTSFKSIDKLKSQINCLLKCNQLQRDRFFDSSSTPISHISKSIQDLRAAQDNYLSTTSYFKTLWDQLQSIPDDSIPIEEIHKNRD